MTKTKIVSCGQGAALMAAKILGINNSKVRDAVADLQRRNRERLFVDDVLSTSTSLTPEIRARHQAKEVITETDLTNTFGASEKRSGKVSSE